MEQQYPFQIWLMDFNRVKRGLFLFYSVFFLVCHIIHIKGNSKFLQSSRCKWLLLKCCLVHLIAKNSISQNRDYRSTNLCFTELTLHFKCYLSWVVVEKVYPCPEHTIAAGELIYYLQALSLHGRFFQCSRNVMSSQCKAG